jgi:hypothetical protein
MAENPELQGYLEKARETFTNGMELLQDMTGWENVPTTQEDVTLFKRDSEDSPFATVKC